jgi:hypothetical protein
MGRPFPRSADAGLGALSFALSFGIYLRTLYPGLNGIGDTPKFQFVGAILGTPHPPGYPVYTLLAWLFSKLPFANLAWRANLLSAVAAALSVALVFMAARRLGVRPVAALATSLAFACGPVFWSQATLAEVYALAAALLAAVLLATLAWGLGERGGGPGLAVLLASLAMAHHTTFAMVVPALVLYVLVTDRRAALAPPFLLRGFLLVAAGLSPYLLVLLRNLQGAPYLGARARSLGELWDVMRGAAFEGRVFAFDLQVLATERLALVGGVLRRELGLVGMLLAPLGLLALARRAPREATLLGLATGGLLLFVLGYDVPDLDVFLVTAFVPLWILAGVGLEAALSRVPVAVPRGVLGAAVLALPLAQAALHFRQSDHSDRSFEMRYFSALFAALPQRAAIAAESYTVDHMVLYELLGERAAQGREVSSIPAAAESVESAARRGASVFAFERTAAALRPLGFRFASVRLPGVSLHEHIAALPGGRFVLQAGLRDGTSLAAIGTPEMPEALARRGPGASVEAAPGLRLGALPVPVALRAEVADAGAVWAGDARLQRSPDGLALAVLGPGGRLLEAHDLDATLRVPMDDRPFPLYRLVGLPECRDLGDGEWTDVTSAAVSGRLLLRIDNHAPFEADVVAWAFGERPFEPRLVQGEGHGTPAVELRTFAGPDAWRATLAADGLAATPAAAHAARLALRVDDGGQFFTSSLDLGGLASSAWARARVDLRNPRRAQACSLVPGDVDPSAPALSVAFGPSAQAFLGAGWHAPEPAGLRWTSAAAAELLLPVAGKTRARLRLRAMPLAGPGVAPTTLAVEWNGAAVGSRALAPGFAIHEFEVAAPVLRDGTNRVTLRVAGLRRPRELGLGGDGRAVGVAVSDLWLRAE